MTQPTLLIVAALLLLIATAAVTLYLDARQRKIDRQLAIALAPSQAEVAPSIRRIRTVAKSSLLFRLVRYDPELRYDWGPYYVLSVATIAAAASVAGSLMFNFSPALALVGALVEAVVVTRFLFNWQRRRTANRLFRQLPDTIEIITSAVRSGLPVNEAFRVIAREMPQPTAGQFALVCNELALGGPVEEALDGVYRRTGVPEYGFFAVTLSVQLKAGGSLAETLQTLADTVRQRVALAARAKALAGEVIFSSRALTLAPIVIGGWLWTFSRPLVDMLFTDPSGQKMLIYAATSVLIGNIVMNWMIKKDTAI